MPQIRPMAVYRARHRGKAVHNILAAAAAGRGLGLTSPPALGLRVDRAVRAAVSVLCSTACAATHPISPASGHWS